MVKLQEILLEIGVILRGFVLCSAIFRDDPALKIEDKETSKNLRGAFISAINSFAESYFSSDAELEYLQSGEVLCIFKVGEIKGNDSIKKEPVIIYAITSKKRNPDKIVRKFMEKANPMLEYFVQKYSKKDFTDLDSFRSFEKEIFDYFE